MMYTVSANPDELVIRHVRANRSGRYDIDRDFRRHATKGGITTVAGQVSIQDSDVTVLLITSGIAVCSPTDVYDRERGYKEAFKRAAVSAVENYTRKKSKGVIWLSPVDTKDTMIIVEV